MLSTLRPSGVVNRVSPEHGKLVILIAGSIKRRSLLIAGDGRGRRSATHQSILFMTESLYVMPKTTEQKSTVRIGKSEAEVTNNKRCARGIVLLNLTTDRHEASRGLSATAQLLVLICYGVDNSTCGYCGELTNEGYENKVTGLRECWLASRKLMHL